MARRTTNPATRKPAAKRPAPNAFHASILARGGRIECPFCGSVGPHDDNGCSNRELTWLCECGEQFDAFDV
jgi:hypothetical protein